LNRASIFLEVLMLFFYKGFLKFILTALLLTTPVYAEGAGSVEVIQNRWHELVREKRSLESQATSLKKTHQIQEEHLGILRARLRELNKALGVEDYDTQVDDALAKEEDRRLEELNLVESLAQNFVVVGGNNKSPGTGFLVRQEDRVDLYTSSHLVGPHEGIEIKNRDLEAIPITGNLSCTTGLDLVTLHPTSTDLAGLELSSSAELPEIGDRVVVIHLHPTTLKVRGIRSRVRGIGPDKLELDADLLPDMSGAPVIAVETGRIIGVTEPQIEGATANWATGTRHEFSRSFATRLDQPRNWRTVDFTRFAREASYLEKIKERVHLVWLSHMLMDIAWRRVQLRYGRDSPIYFEFDSEEESDEAEKKWDEKEAKEREYLERTWPAISRMVQPYRSNPHVAKALVWASKCQRANRRTNLDELKDDRAVVYRSIHAEFSKKGPDHSAHLTGFHADQYKAVMQSRSEGLKIISQQADRSGH